jgi:hypothetical protein
VASASAILSVPEVEQPFVGSAIVSATDGEILTLKFENDSLRLQVKVRDGPLNTAPGDPASVYFKFSGDPFARDDVLWMTLTHDEFVHVLVGGDEPIDLQFEAALGLEQLPRRTVVVTPIGADTVRPVRVSLGCEQKLFLPGQQLDFSDVRLTAKLLASTGYVGNDIGIVEGDSFRVSLLAWQRPEVLPPPPPAPVTGTVCGRVTSSADGSAILGALVGTSPATATALSDAEGNFVITVPIPTNPTSYAVTASKDGFSSASASASLLPPWNTLKTARVRIVLTPQSGP